MRREQILASLSMCLALMLTVAFAGPPAASAATRPGSVLPAGFQAQSQSWASAKDGWLLGVAPCGQKTCTTVVGTTDGGATWNILATINAPMTYEKGAGVTEIRFADAMHGWLLAPAFWATTDGGVTWTKQAPPGGGHMVTALAGDSDAVYAVVTPCKLNQLCKKRGALWRTTVSSGSWTKVSLTLSRKLILGTAVLKVEGVVGYLVVPTETEPDVLDATTDGQTWSSRPDPCLKSNDEMLVDVAPSSGTNVALLCVGDPGFSMADKRVLRSTDAGMTTSPAGSTPRNGFTSQIAAASNGTLAVSSYSDGSWIYRNGGGQTWTTPVIQADGGQGWNDITFTTNKVGWVVYSPVATPGHAGLLVETTNGGLSWAPV